MSPLPETEPLCDEALPAESLLENEQVIALIGSMLVHLIVILTAALLPLGIRIDEEAVVIVSPPVYSPQELEQIQEVTYSDVPEVAVGANSMADAAMAEASAQTFAELAEIPNLIDLEPTELGQIMVNNILQQAIAPTDRLIQQKGRFGEGTEGAAGAVDRITFEIVKSMEERPTLVVWLFDQSGSLYRQRKEIRNRFDRIYQELGIYRRAKEDAPRKRNQDEDDIPLLTSIVGFGDGVQLFTPKPTDDLDEIQSILDNMDVDSSGVELAFTALKKTVDRYKSLRRSVGGRPPKRNVMFVTVTDERGDDADLLESTIVGCRKWGIPVYVIGVPAPFGREHTLVKYVDPDTRFDQTPRWAEVDQGPETLMLERVQFGSAVSAREPVMDSGFGPYALTRLCSETGGIYFAVHPNRNVNRRVRRNEVTAYAADLDYFFDPSVMARYRPDYLSPDDYLAMVQSSPLRNALVSAARLQPPQVLSDPRTRFVRRDEEAQLVGELTRAQQDAAKLEPMLNHMANVLQLGMPFREQETVLRWKAGFDLAMGRVLAQKVRTETYNAMLAKAKRGMPFGNPKNNTWILKPSDQITVGSKWKSQAETAALLLNDVREQHAGTPWAMLAQQELKTPLGWEWAETYTDLSPPRPNQGNPNNNNNAMPRDERARMLNRAPSRPIPKL